MILVKKLYPIHNTNQEDSNDSYVFRYALLGASGCGKTTVLSSIVGLKKLDEGTISVFGGIPGESSYGIPGSRVGYMPQVSLLQNILLFSISIFRGDLYSSQY